MTSGASGPWLVIPDLHGHRARLDAALRVATLHPDARLVFLGDLIDDSSRRREARGADFTPGEADDSRAILTTVRGLVEAGQADVLLGNHEAMACAAVLDDHRPLMDLWWRVGGREAATSFGWNGKGEAGELAEMLAWWRDHARLWLSIGPPGAQVLLSHATRPTRGRVEQGHYQAAALLDDAEDPVVWHPLGLETDNGAVVRSLPLLPDGHTASLHGHMETPALWTLMDREGQPAYQLDLHPSQKQLIGGLVTPDGELEPLTVDL